jgi:hypothetical protein
MLRALGLAFWIIFKALLIITHFSSKVINNEMFQQNVYLFCLRRNASFLIEVLKRKLKRMGLCRNATRHKSESDVGAKVAEI